MPDINGESFWSEQYGVSDSCADCGAAVPTMEEHDMRIYETDGRQLCGDCSPHWNSLNDGDGNQIY